MAVTTPRGLESAGRRLWKRVNERYALDESAQVVLAEACYQLDLLAGLRAELAAAGSLMSESSQGSRVHPAIVELRQGRLALSRMIRDLALPADVLDGGE